MYSFQPFFITLHPIMKAKLNTTILELSNAPLFKRVKKIVSAPFFLMVVASFALWYIAKLGYTYTTEIDVKIKVVDQKITTTCVVEGVGTNLIGYKIYSGGAINISMVDAKYSVETLDDIQYIYLDQEMLNKAISVHYSDIKVISVEPVERIEVSEKIQKAIDKL